MNDRHDHADTSPDEARRRHRDEAEAAPPTQWSEDAGTRKAPESQRDRRSDVRSSPGQGTTSPEPGHGEAAADVGAAEFIDLILTEWYEDPERARFLSGLADVDSSSQALFGKDFVDCSSLQQSDILKALGQQMAEEVGEQTRPLRRRGVSAPANFYAMLRQLTLTAYYTSEAGATDELHFEMIPGSYQGCPPGSVKEEPEQR